MTLLSKLKEIYGTWMGGFVLGIQISAVIIITMYSYPTLGGVTLFSKFNISGPVLNHPLRNHANLDNYKKEAIVMVEIRMGAKNNRRRRKKVLER